MGVDMIGKVYGYHRANKYAERLSQGNDAIIDFCYAHNLILETIYYDVQRNRKFPGKRYTALKNELLHENDLLIITEYDCLGRAYQAKEELKYFQEHKIKVVFLDIPFSWEYNWEINRTKDELSHTMSDFADRMLVQFYEVMAKTEKSKRVKRQAEGIDFLRESGEWERYGRPRKMSQEEFRENYKRVENGEISNNKLAKELGMPFSRYYRYKKEMLQNM